ncbi:alpha/beta fold hydrolase [Ekhidna sp.]
MKKLIIILTITSSHILSAQDDEMIPSYKYNTEKVTISEGIELAYVNEGPQDAPVILMVHGLGGYIKNWYPTIDGLKETYRCIALDLPGYGQSTIRDFEKEDYMQFFANSVNEFAEKLELNKVILMGHSMGGQVSIVMALQNPKWLERLILAAPAGFETFTEAEGTLLKQFSTASALMSHTEEQIYAAYQANFVSMPALAEEMIQDRLKAKEAMWFADYALIREMGVKGMLRHSVKEDLSKIKIPTVVLFGKNDFLIPNKYLHPSLTTSQIAEIGKEIPNVKIKLIETAGHMLQMDNPTSFNLAVKQLLTY